MSESEGIPLPRPPITSAVYIFLTAAAGFIIVGPAIGFLLAFPFIDGGLVYFAETKINNPQLYPEIKIPYLIIQGSATFFGLTVGPALYWFAFEKKNVFDLVTKKSTSLLTFLLVSILVLAFIAPNSVIIEWNAHVSLPGFLKDFETSVRDLESKAEQLTRFFTTIGSPSQFALIFLVVAVLPSIGEELVFRGMLQPQLQKATRNAHAGIWISAFLFSAMHMQFFGFVPRVFLGALLGYLYFWSGNLAVPMLAHLVNNGFSVVMLYLQQLGKVDADVENEVVPWPIIIPATMLTIGLLIYLRKRFESPPVSS